MNAAIQSLIQSGTKLYLDSVDPELVAKNIAWGAVGATSNPVIVSGLISSGRFDAELERYAAEGQDNHAVAWRLTDSLVSAAEKAFLPVWEKTNGNAGWVSFELDPLIEDDSLGLKHAERVARYVELGKQWSEGHPNRMIKVPATPAGIEALSPLAAAGVTLNVTLIFTLNQYKQARTKVWEGAQQRPSLDRFKSVYSIFVSRVDQYTQSHVANLSAKSQGMMGIVNAKQIWDANRLFWEQHPTPLQQEIIFASTGTKDPKLPPWKYVQALAGSDIQTNPPDTNDAVAASDQLFTCQVNQMPDTGIIDELAIKVDIDDMYRFLMKDGLEKFCSPQKKLLATIAERSQKAIA